MSNPELVWLENLKTKAIELNKQEEAAKKTIRDGFVNRAIVFIDIVGSTAFKLNYPTNPEIWILRVKQFSELLANAVKNCSGSVVKYIGDEVMASFDNVNDAQNLVARVAEIENSLRQGTGFETRVKIAVDFGFVYELKFEDHSIQDPQGTVVDRCARIAKYGMPGEVLASSSFVEQTPKLNWKKAGAIELKGLGRQIIYQLEHVTVSLEEKIEVVKEEFQKTLEERDELRAENSKLRENNLLLQDQIAQLGQKPNPEATISDEDSDDWNLFDNKIQSLRKLINDAPGSSDYYARFVFLYQADKGPEKYNSFEGKVFDELIESNLVYNNGSGYYQLNTSHPRNKKILSTLTELERDLNNYLKEHDPNPDDLFEWDLSDSGFWKKYLKYNVV